MGKLIPVHPGWAITLDPHIWSANHCFRSSEGIPLPYMNPQSWIKAVFSARMARRFLCLDFCYHDSPIFSTEGKIQNKCFFCSLFFYRFFLVQVVRVWNTDDMDPTQTPWRLHWGGPCLSIWETVFFENEEGINMKMPNSNPWKFRKVSYLILFCSVKSPSLTNIADNNRSVEFADFDWLFFIPKSQRTRSLIAWTYTKVMIVR